MRQSATNQSNLTVRYETPKVGIVNIKMRHMMCLSANTESMGYEDMNGGDSGTEKMGFDEFEF